LKWEDVDWNLSTAHSKQYQEGFRKLLKASGLPKIRFHDLQHTAASLMLNHGIPVLIVSKRLGHSKPGITIDVYGHIIPSRQEEAAQLMDDVNCTKLHHSQKE